MNGWESCPVCGSWERKRTLKTHMNSAHGNKSPNFTAEGRHTCLVCPSTFRRPYNLKRHHKLVHNKELPVGPLAMVSKFISQKPPKKPESPKQRQHLKIQPDFSKNPIKIKFKVVYNYSSSYREWLIATCERQGIKSNHLRQGPSNPK